MKMSLNYIFSTFFLLCLGSSQLFSQFITVKDEVTLDPIPEVAVSITTVVNGSRKTTSLQATNERGRIEMPVSVEKITFKHSDYETASYTPEEIKVAGYTIFLHMLPLT